MNPPGTASDGKAVHSADHVLNAAQRRKTASRRFEVPPPQTAIHFASSVQIASREALTSEGSRRPGIWSSARCSGDP